jgi:hypothetical protein
MSVYEKALLDPASAFTMPEQVVTSTELSREQKIEILHRWEYDARQLGVAEEENMLSNSDQPDIRDEILRLSVCPRRRARCRPFRADQTGWRVTIESRVVRRACRSISPRLS